MRYFKNAVIRIKSIPFNSVQKRPCTVEYTNVLLLVNDDKEAWIFDDFKKRFSSVEDREITSLGVEISQDKFNRKLNKSIKSWKK